MEQEVILCYDGLDVRSPGIKKEMKKWHPIKMMIPCTILKLPSNPALWMDTKLEWSSTMSRRKRCFSRVLTLILTGRSIR